MKKRVLSVLLILALFVSCFAFSAGAEGTPTICVSDAGSVARGSEVSIDIAVANNPGIMSFSLTVTYDASRLSLVSLGQGAVTGSGFWTVNGARATWVASSDVKTDGTIMTATFKVLDDAPMGAAAVGVSYKAGDIGNYNEEEVNFAVVPGGVTVACVNHVWESKVTKEPTCTEKGEKTFACTVCGAVDHTEEIPALGHSWNDGVVTTEPGCETEGVKTFTCTVCGQTKTEPISAIGHHSWNDGVVTTEPGCETEGVKTYTCAVCDQTKTEPIPVKGHAWDEGKVTTEPTCTETGVKTYTCTVCDATETEEIPALGHTWDEGKVTKEPTCAAVGEKTYTCTVCDETKTEEIPVLEHKWDNGVVTLPATNTKEGEKTYTCTVCGETKTEAIPKVKDVIVTGDESTPVLYALLLIASAGAAVIVTRKVRKERG